MDPKPQAGLAAPLACAHRRADTRLVRAVIEALEARRLLATFTVNTTADTVDADPAVTSLREAIEASNTLAGVDRIEFNIGGGGPQTIRPTTFLPAIITGVILDARTQPGYAGTPIIQISGELAGANSDGLRVGSQGSTIRGLVISRFGAQAIQVTALANGNTIAGNYIGTDFTGAAAEPNTRGILLRGFNNTIGGVTPEDRNVISGNASANPSLGRGIELTGASATANVILGNYVGVNAAGTAALANTGDGITVVAGAHGNTIGGDTTAGRNLISGNARVGIWVNGFTTSGNLIQNNFIGTNPAGTAAIPNGFEGLSIDNAPSNTVSGNVISGNTFAGVRLAGSGTYNNTLRGNRIGTNAAGNAAVPNLGDGISLTGGPTNNTIGGTAPGDGNLISGNARVGVWINGSSTSGNRLLGNLIGTDAAGAAALGNGFRGDALPGVMLDNAPANTVGGAGPGAGNVISGNNQAGVRISGFNAFSNRIFGNRIGADAAGAASLGNAGPGVLIHNGAYFNRIGGDGDGLDDPAEGNLIAFNAAAGVAVVDGNSYANSIRYNAVHDNVGLGIDLAADGVTPNDPLDPDFGPNDLQNAPAVTGVRALGGGQFEVTGSLSSAPFNFYTIDLYASPAGNPADVTEGARYLGTTFVSTDEAGRGVFEPATVQLAPGEIVTATATTFLGTSEFSSRVTADPGGPYLFTEGQGSNGQLQVQLAGAALDLGNDSVTVAWDLDNDGLFDDSTVANPTLTLPDDGPTDRPVAIRVTNSAGQTSTNSTLIRIVNAPPQLLEATVNSSENTPLAPGAPTVLTARFTDPGLLDTHTAFVDWGDGTFETLDLTRPANSADGAFAPTHTYATGGRYDILVTVTDDDGWSSGTFYTQAFVTGVGIQYGVLNVVGTAKSDTVVLTANPDGTIDVAASFLASKARLDPIDFYTVNAYLGGKNDHASATGSFIPSVALFAGDGNNTLAAGDGTFYLYGNAGNDAFTGGGGYTAVYAGPGNDTITGGTGYLTAWGDAGNDVITGSTTDAGGDLYGGDGNDVITGSAGVDYITGDAGNDVLRGGDADDYLFGGAGNDVLYGGNGNDSLFGELGADRLFGEDGDDYLVGDDDFFGSPARDNLHGGVGTDTWGDPWHTEDTRTSLELP